MIYELITTTTYTKTVVATFPSFEAAVAFANNAYTIIDFEEDASGDLPAADFFASDGLVYSIQPAA